MKMKSEPVLVDSNVFVAFFNPSDSLHSPSIAILREIEPYTKTIPDLIFAEVGTTLHAKMKDTAFVSDVLHKLLNEKTSSVKTVFCTKQSFSQILEVFSHQHRPWLSIEDCSIVAYARKLGVKKIITFDKGLRKMFAGEFTFLPERF